MPAVRALQATGLGIGVLCRDDQREFWQAESGLEVLSFPLKTKAKAVAPGLGDWQAALLWEPGLAADAVRIAAVPRRVGPEHRSLKKHLTQTLKVAEKPLAHRVRFYLSAVEEMGIPTDQPEFFAAVHHGIEPTRDALLLCPDSDFGPSHEWLPDRWLQLATSLLEHNQRLTVAGLTGGRGLGQALAKALAAEFWPIPALGAVLSDLAAYPRVIAADGSLPHLAARAGVTCITLFGPNDPQWKRPLGKQHTVVRHHVACAPCLLARCPLDGRCQRELESAKVSAALAKCGL